MTTRLGPAAPPPALLSLLAPSSSFALPQRARGAASAAGVDRRRMAERVRAGFPHAWRGADTAYAALKSAETEEEEEGMESFLFAETFRHFHLIFAPPGALDCRAVVFNTEAHPIRRTWGAR